MAVQIGALQMCGATNSDACAGCAVRPFSVCNALNLSELAELERLSEPACFKPKQTVLEEGDPAERVFNITAGMVRLYKLLPDGRRQIVGFLLPGDFLGLAMSDRYGFSADAVDAVTACSFKRSTFTHYVDEKPHLLRRLHEFATHELALAQDQMVLLGRRSAEERIAAFIMGLRDRWARLGMGSVTVPLPMSRQDIGDFLGLTVETVSRTMTRLARDKVLLTVPDGVRILDVARLEQLAAH